jgi:hypothetical protein
MEAWLCNSSSERETPVRPVAVVDPARIFLSQLSARKEGEAKETSAQPE